MLTGLGATCRSSHVGCHCDRDRNSIGRCSHCQLCLRFIVSKMLVLKEGLNIYLMNSFCFQRNQFRFSLCSPLSATFARPLLERVLQLLRLHRKFFCWTRLATSRSVAIDSVFFSLLLIY